ncbi:MAG: prephenate dehydratase [Cyclobacteriaceae bacterium]
MDKELKIAIQGVRGSFHHEASQYVFGNDISLLECTTFSDVTESTVKRDADYGVMAIENSLAGCIIPNYNLLRQSGLEVCGEVGIRVKLNLLALDGESIEGLDEVHSHQMALRQCGSFLNTISDKRIVEAFDTAGSARHILENNLRGVGAIAGNLAASEHGLNVLAAGIEDHKMNYTRFLVLKKEDADPLAGEANKMSIYFQTKHSPGSLAQLLSVISGLGINLSKLQSHPVPSKNSLYGFFATLDLEALDQIKHLEILLEAMTIDYQILGVYKKGETHG